jgi:predicted GNAT family acetyltransferase
MDMEIRKANLKDLDIIYNNRMQFTQLMNNQEISITEEFKQDTYNYIKNHIVDDSLVIWIATEEDEIISVAMVCYYQLLPTISNKKGKTGYIQNVFTLPNYRGRGYATELMNKIIVDAKERNVGRLLLSASDMGRPIYEKIGFEAVTKEMIFTIN